MDQDHMNPRQQFSRKIIEKAVTLTERINSPQNYSCSVTDEQLFQKRLAVWKKIVAPNDPELFLVRIGNDGVSESDLQNLLGQGIITSDQNLPEWTPLFIEMMDYLSLNLSAKTSSDIETIFGRYSEKRAPFIHLLLPFVVFANQKLGSEVNILKTKLFCEEAIHSLNLQLLNGLSYQGAQTLQLEFNIFKSSSQSSFDRLFNKLPSDSNPENALYNDFVNKITLDGWCEFFMEYSALGRIFTIITGNWIRNTAEFINRLNDDYSEIETHFSKDISPGLLKSFKAAISDSHNQGRAVASLEFESGLKLIYKPKNLEIEQAFSSLLSWFNENGLKPAQKLLDIIQKGEYGWVGFIEADECKSEEDVSDYYRRIGALTGIIYMLNGNDCHYENLIASGPFPVIIDLETIMHHEGKNYENIDPVTAFTLANDHFRRSVLQSCLLPGWTIGSGSVFDVSALGGYGDPYANLESMVYKDINTDRMRIEVEKFKDIDHAHLPVLNGQKCLPVGFTSDIIAGFTSFYTLVLEQRKNIPIFLFADKELRFVFRATRIYGMILKKLTDPSYMRHGIDRSLQLESLSRAFLHAPSPNAFWPHFKSEIRQMEEMDIPIFWSDSGCINLKDNKGILVEDYMRYPVFNQVESQLMEMDKKDMLKQISYIRASLFFRENGGLHSDLSIKENQFKKENILPVNSELLLKAATEIGHKLFEEAIFSNDGGCSWISPVIIGDSGKLAMQPISWFLYEGLAGVALFISALRSISDDPEIVKLNEALLISLKQGLKQLENPSSFLRVETSGIASGAPSLIYSLLKVSEFSNDKSLIENAKSLTASINEKAIRSDNKHDIISGNAGSILAFLHLFHATKDIGILEKAILCGNHLLETVRESPDGMAGWPDSQGNILTGFSHGSAGIAFSLLKLFEATGDTKYFSIAVRAISYENSHFSAEFKNWKDLRDLSGLANISKQQYSTQWCHGAPGIGLARLAGKRIFNNDSVESDISSALETTKQKLLGARDYLCCGNMGRIEVLHYASLEMNDPELMKIAMEGASQIITRAEKKGNYNILTGEAEEVFNPGFFRGISGIGYEFIRMAYPEKFPSVLIFK
jgi:type 2 lantibiotic biosynthesis protein LanM